MAVTISGMFGSGHTYFADSPVVIDISGLEWPASSPFTIVRVEVYYNSRKIGDFRADTGGQTSISFDISSALVAIWADYNYALEPAAAQLATAGSGDTGYTALTDNIDFFNANPGTRKYREYSLIVYTEYLASDGQPATTSSGMIAGGQCAVGGFTELERSLILSKEEADLSYYEGSNLRNGDASTKPTSTPERVGKTSITSWVDINNGGTKSVFYPATAHGGTGTADSQSAHAPLVLRDKQTYVDFLFINRRGAVETCSGLSKDAMSISSSLQQYSHSDGVAFTPSRSLMAIGTDGRRSWQMSSGYVTREWAEWWAKEFLGGKQKKRWWMLWQGPGMQAPRYVPVTVKSTKSDIVIYDKQKQQMAHVDFTVTLALEG